MFGLKSSSASTKRLVAVISAAIFAITIGVVLSASLSIASCRTVQPGSENARRALETTVRASAAPTDETLTRFERDNANTFIAALARLARVQNKLNNNDANAALALLDAEALRLIKSSTAIDDYAQFLRAETLAKLNRMTEARAAFEQLARDYPNSLRARDATLRAAEIALNAGGAAAAASVPLLVKTLTDRDDAAALLLVARSYEQQNDNAQAQRFYRRVFFYAPASPEADTASLKLNLAGNNSPLDTTAAEAATRAEKLYTARRYAQAADAYALLFLLGAATPDAQLKRGIAALNAKRTTEAVAALRAVPASSKLHAEALYNLTLAFARAGQWEAMRLAANDLRRLYPKDILTARALSDAGFEAKAKGYTVGAQEFFQLAVAMFPGIAETANAQFEVAWAAHERRDFQTSSRLLIEHLANYADKNTDNRGRAGYWAARDSQLAGNTLNAQILYDAMMQRYDANWYGYLAKQRQAEMVKAGQSVKYELCSECPVGRAYANLKTVAIAPESASAFAASAAINKAKQLATIAFDDAAFAELRNVSKETPDSPRLNLALAQLHQSRFEMVEAFNALRRSFPDYSQMKPEELTDEQWTIFYPLTNWETIKQEASRNSLDAYNVAGLIRQESVYNPRAKSAANAFGLMQLVLPTAQSTARRIGIEGSIGASDLYNPLLNIKLGTAYFRAQLDKYGKIEYVAAAYNAGPGRATRWIADLPAPLDEWAEAIPFRETKAYVQGVIRNTLQYKRLYDEQGRFRANVGTQAASSRPATTNNGTRARQATVQPEDE